MSPAIIDVATLTGIVWGIVQGLKMAVGKGFTRFMPLASDVLGAVGGYFFLGQNKEAIALGLIVGLSASGLYSQGKTVAGR